VVTLLRMSELAGRSGVPASTLRYYERIGLVEPLGRSDNGYRVYEEATVERLAFIGRAKRLGMSLDDVATLVEAWFAGECEPLQDRLRVFVTARIGELRDWIAEDSAFERQLERILVRLGDGGAVQGRCGPDCGCDTDPLGATGALADAPAIACSLGQGDARRRIFDWQQVLGLATRTEGAVGGVRAVFEPSAEVIAELARLCAAETGCCPFLTFDLEISGAAIVLTIAGGAGAEELLGRFFDLTQPGRPPSPARIPAAERKLPSREPHGAGGFIPVYAPAASGPERGEPARAEGTLIR
jgi:DNA-binding transcriptional MerR regulator